MKKLLFFVSIFCTTLFFNDAVFAQYSNATLNGPWFLDTIPAQIYNDVYTNYLVFDGNGNIIDGSMFCNAISGSYSVTAGGAVSGSFTCDGSPFPFSAQLISQNYAPCLPLGSGWAFSRVMNPGALTDSLVGTLFTTNCGQRNVTLRLNSQGQIVSGSGLMSPVTGRVYADSGHFEGHIRTGEANGWDAFTIIGAYSNDSLTGKTELNSNGCGANTARLKRFGTISGIIPVAASTLNVMVYPNPAVDVITLKINNANNKDKLLTIYNVFGEVVRSELLKQNMQKINISELNNGIYLLLINTDKWSVKQKLLIQR
jgi:hypothetical protein